MPNWEANAELDGNRSRERLNTQSKPEQVNGSHASNVLRPNKKQEMPSVAF